MNWSKISSAAFTVLVLLVSAVLLTVAVRRPKPETGHDPGALTVTRTDTVFVMDTVTVTRPVETVRWLVRTDTVTVVTLDRDTVRIEAPVERKIYQDSTYRAVISGIRPTLDSITVYRSTVTVMRTVREPAKRWTFGATAGPAVIADLNGSVRAGAGIAIGLTYHF